MVRAYCGGMPAAGGAAGAAIAACCGAMPAAGIMTTCGTRQSSSWPVPRSSSTSAGQERNGVV